MLPEVEEYLNTRNELDANVETWRREFYTTEPHRQWGWGYDSPEYAAYREKYNEWQERFATEQRKQDAAYNSALRAARTKLRESTDNEMIIWMMDNLKNGYWSYIDTVLPILPATREELETLANEQDWCTEFDGFLDDATKAGVIPPANEKYDAQEIVDYISDEFDVYGREHRRQIQAMVNKIVEKALAEKEKATVPSEMVTV